MLPQIQTTVLKNLLNNQDFTRRVIPYLKSEYFEGDHRVVFGEISSFVAKYNSLPNKESLVIEMESSDNVSENAFQSCVEIVNEITVVEAPSDLSWLLQTTEKWCQDRAIYLSIMESVNIIDGKGGDNTVNVIPSLLSDALAVSFDQHIGHDYYEDAAERFAEYSKPKNKLKFDLDYLNRITDDGVETMSLNMIMAGTGTGKSLYLCHLSSSYITSGHNVLYITMEMAENKIAERIDANILDRDISSIKYMKSDDFVDKIDRLKSKHNGKLIIKQYPTGSAHAGHFRALLNELKLKKQFTPDVIMIDYLNICASSRIKGAAANSYTIVKSIAEELRGLGVEFGVPIWSATQTNRAGQADSDVGLENVSESHGLSATCDLMLAMISTEELASLNQVMFKQLKNRYNDMNKHMRFVVGIDRSKMKLYDSEDSSQTLIESNPVENKKDIKDFSGFTI